LAAGSDTRYAIYCVRVRELADAHFRLEATDGRVLGILRGPSAPTAADRKAAASLPEPDALALEALLPRRGFLEAIRGLKGEARLAVRLAKPEVLMASGDSLTRLDCLDGRFPDVDGVLPKSPAPVSFRVDAGLLVRLLKAAGAVAGDSSAVEVLYFGRDKPIGVIARGAGGVTFDGLIMPLST
jgi:hypothetical protein